MACKDPLKKCSSPTPSGCVEWTGNLSQSTRIIVDDCSVSINAVIEQIDYNLLQLHKGMQIKVSDITNNDPCGKIDLSNITHRDNNYNYEYTTSSEVIQQLVKNECDLQDQISIVHNGVTINTSFFDLKLPSNIRNMLSCLSCDNGCDPVQPLTMKDFFEIIAKKIVELPCKPCEGGCIDC